MSTSATAAASHELVITRRIDAPPSEVFRAWADPDLLKQWFAPAPWTTPVAELDVRPGGSNLIVMRSPDGDDMPNRGVYLEVVENERLVFTDAYTEAWVPSEKPFMTVVLTFEESRPGGRSHTSDRSRSSDRSHSAERAHSGDRTHGAACLYTARVRHWSEADRLAHENMGFHEGWGLCTDQLVALVTGRQG